MDVILFVEIFQNCMVRQVFWENVLDSFSCFYIEIAFSKFTFCAAYMLSFLAHHTISAKKAHPRTGNPLIIFPAAGTLKISSLSPSPQRKPGFCRYSINHYLL